jgi:hypothetical protein
MEPPFNHFLLRFAEQSWAFHLFIFSLPTSGEMIFRSDGTPDNHSLLCPTPVMGVSYDYSL